MTVFAACGVVAAGTESKAAACMLIRSKLQYCAFFVMVMGFMAHQYIAPDRNYISPNDVWCSLLYPMLCAKANDSILKHTNRPCLVLTSSACMQIVLW